MWSRRSTSVQPYDGTVETYDDEAKWKSCRGHVRILADIIAALGIALGILEIIEAAIWGPLWNLAGAIVLIIICALVIVADRIEKSLLYLPYLILSIIGILVYLGLGITLLVFGIVLPNNYVQRFSDNGYTNPTKSARIYAFVLMGISFIVLIISLWAWYIVFKAYKFMKDVVEYQKKAVAPLPDTPSNIYSDGLPTYRYVPSYSYI